MAKGRKRVVNPKIAGVLAALAAGTALFTFQGGNRQGTAVNSAYEELEEKSDYTLLVYMDGSNLESDYGAATADIEEMLAAISSEAAAEGTSFQLVVEAGGAESWKLPVMEEAEYARFCLSGGKITGFEPMEVRNMAEESTLTDFINYGVQSYPARHYGLILWNHGGGPIGGYGSDSNFDGAGLPIEGIGGAIDQSVMKETPFEFVAFDACLMGSVEMAEALEGRTNYLIASPELEPQDGYDYGWLNVFRQKEVTGKEIGEAMVDKYLEYYKNQDFPVALSLIDMSKYGAFHDAFRDCLEEIPVEMRDRLYAKIGKERKSLQTFGSRSAGYAPELVDLMDLMKLCENEEEENGRGSGQDAESSQYDKFKKAAGELVIKHGARGYGKEPGGLTVYLPGGSNPYLAEDMNTYLSTGFCEAYMDLMRGYEAYLTEPGGLEAGTAHSEPGDGAVTVEVAPESLPSVMGAYLTVFCEMDEDGYYYLLSTDSDVSIGADGTLKAVPEEEYPGLMGQALCLIETMNMESYTEYMAPVLLNGRLCTMLIRFDADQEEGKIVSLTPAGSTSCTAKEIYSLTLGDELVPLYPIEKMEDVPEDAGTETVDFNSISDGTAGEIPDMEGVYDRTYYMGRKMTVETGDDERLEQIPVNGTQCLYGFMLTDVRQRICYTDFTKQ